MEEGTARVRKESKESDDSKDQSAREKCERRKFMIVPLHLDLGLFGLLGLLFSTYQKAPHFWGAFGTEGNSIPQICHPESLALDARAYRGVNPGSSWT